MSVQRPCIRHRCTEYALPGESRCERHQREFAASRFDAGSTGQRGSRGNWRKTRLRVWREQGRVCGRCRRRVKDFFLHHIDGDARNNERANLVALCTQCHRDADAAVKAKKSFDSRRPTNKI